MSTEPTRRGRKAAKTSPAASAAPAPAAAPVAPSRPPAAIADRAGMRQVADRAGVAMSSVSRVLSGHPDVSAAMRSRVMAAVEELGYEPNMLAQMLRKGATQTIGFVVGDISNPLLAQIALGAEVALRAAGYAMLLTNSVNQPNLDATHIRLLQQRRVDGLLLSLSDETNDQTIEALSATPTPSVLIDRDLRTRTEESAVLSDHAAGITQAVEHLVGLGHRRIALIAGSPHVRPTRERINALEEAVEAHPEVHAQVRPGAFTEVHGGAATRELLDGRRPPTAIIAGGNQILVGVLGELAARQVRIPDDISLVTCDDVPLAKFFTPTLATIGRDPYEMGAEAAALLLARFGGAEPGVITLPTSFTGGRSCAAPPRTAPPAQGERP
ncbi:LacI family DNA-binding transcriptional regulator [Actinacidiphila alni]|uniref:Transcriptional regulator, LacI family n=1 Tax=Actinacidiphila alni TaxID=380248 RepID=A0A1I2H646_9ACTN|nr:LacI family DNA-binding transcriptional regulator [Actinacidiphila alni]SFF25654.1 transcriptional regulator, LacI family [Actinacidiphila alni]